MIEIIFSLSDKDYFQNPLIAKVDEVEQNRLIDLHTYTDLVDCVHVLQMGIKQAIHPLALLSYTKPTT